MGEIMLKKIIFSLMAMLIFLLSYGCKQAKEEVKVKRFGATYMTLNNSFFEVLNSGVEEIVKLKNDQLIVFDPKLDNENQIDGIENLAAQKVDAIFLNPVDWKGIKKGLEIANKAKIPVFVVDAPVYDDNLVVSTIASDNFNAGVLCAEHLTKKLNISKANIVILEHPEAKSGLDRIRGFEEYIKDFPELKIIDRGSSLGQTEVAMPVMEKIIKNTNEKIDVVMCLNDPTAFGVIAALEKWGKLKGTIIYGVDGTEIAMEMIKKGKMTATAKQFPEEIGKIAAKTAYKYFDGEKVDHEIKVPVKLIDKEQLTKQ